MDQEMGRMERLHLTLLASFPHMKSWIILDKKPRNGTGFPIDKFAENGSRHICNAFEQYKCIL